MLVKFKNMFYLIEKLKDNEKYKISKLNESKFWIQMSVGGKKKV